MRAALDILNYVSKQPQATHTAEGIAKYWIFQQRLEEYLETVVAAVEFLVQEGILEEVQSPSGEKYYRLDPKQKSEIPELIKNLKST